MSDVESFATIAALVMDVDGVLTDGTFEWSGAEGESKRFCFEDVMGLSRARRAGISLGLISGEDGILIDRFAAKTGIDQVFKGCKDKGAALERFAAATGVALARIAYIGDDVNDLPALALAGLSAAPSTAQPQVQRAVSLVLERGGGHGAVRELIELILSARQAEAR